MPSSPYDDIAGMYDVFWSDWYLPAAMRALDTLFFSRIQAEARILDVCCGSGHVTTELVRRGYQVSGVDQSAALITIARRKLPRTRFYVQSVQELDIDDRFDAAISTFDSLNHILSLDDLRRSLQRVREHLHPGGIFVFDMNLEEAYYLDLRQWQASVTDDSVTLTRGSYDPVAKKAQTELLWFYRQQGELWVNRRSVVEQQCYTQDEIIASLWSAGFSSVEAIMAAQAGMAPDMAIGRIFFVATRS